jgi:hypothetical protein
MITNRRQSTRLMPKGLRASLLAARGIWLGWQASADYPNGGWPAHIEPELLQYGRQIPALPHSGRGPMKANGGSSASAANAGGSNARASSKRPSAK